MSPVEKLILENQEAIMQALALIIAKTHDDPATAVHSAEFRILTRQVEATKRVVRK